jgi:hypothetical protein
VCVCVWCGVCVCVCACVCRYKVFTALYQMKAKAARVCVRARVLLPQLSLLCTM